MTNIADSIVALGSCEFGLEIVELELGDGTERLCRSIALSGDYDGPSDVFRALDSIERTMRELSAGVANATKTAVRNPREDLR